jgi:4'-phosphopantetheinyl transferase
MARSEQEPGATAGVWLVRLPTDEGAVAAHRRLLDDDERERADRLRRPEHRARFIAAHGARRVLLGGALGLDPAALAFGRDPCPLCGDRHGRPHLVGTDRAISLSHTRGMAAIALGPPGITVGVDVESVDHRVDPDDLAAGLHPTEAATLAALPADRRPLAALRYWVRKEAYLKGTGTGLGVDPASVEVGAGTADWTVTDLDAGSAHVAAVAVDTPAGVALDVRRLELAAATDRPL